MKSFWYRIIELYRKTVPVCAMNYCTNLQSGVIMRFIEVRRCYSTSLIGKGESRWSEMPPSTNPKAIVSQKIRGTQQRNSWSISTNRKTQQRVWIVKRLESRSRSDLDPWSSWHASWKHLIAQMRSSFKCADLSVDLMARIKCCIRWNPNPKESPFG
jgi:hypothetical protein